MQVKLKVKLLVATHKSYGFPDDTIYQPIEVGAALRDAGLGYLRDDTGQNISDKNGSFCELTALYWAWKNHYFDDMDYVGLVHYRRYFSGQKSFADEKVGEVKILDEEGIKTLLSSHDVIVPKKRHYYIETVSSHYAHAHYREDMESLRRTIQDISPEYQQAFDQIMKERSLYLYNMFVMSAPLFEDYCRWLFPLFFSLEEKIDIGDRNAYQKRVFGFMGERLFNVWLRHRGLKLAEVSIVNLEGENLFDKGLGMIKRMIFDKRRES